MKLLFFGTSSAIPAVGNGYTSFLVAIENYRILIDTGDNPVKALLECGEDPRALDAVVLTHAHIDHLGAFPSLISALDCMKREKPLKIIAAGETQEVAEKLLRLYPLDPTSLCFPLEYGDTLVWEPVGTAERVSIARTEVRHHVSLSLLPGKHAVPTSMVQILCRNAAETTESKMEGTTYAAQAKKQTLKKHTPLRFLYTSDYYHGAEVKSPAGEADILIHEATYPHEGLPSITSHSSARQAGIAAEKSNTRLLFLCHFEVSAYVRGMEAAAEEASRAFRGSVIVPNLYQWYNIPDFT